VGVERSQVEADKAARLAPTAEVKVASFFDISPDDFGGPFDAVIGNPPYVRYHGFTGEERVKGLARARAVGVELTRLASSWAHFVAHATAFLSPHGRLGLVLPAELLVTDYAEAIRQHLQATFRSISIVTFDRMIFQNAQVDAVVLLASNDAAETGMRFIRLRNAQAIADLDVSRVGALSAVWTGRWLSPLDTEAHATYQRLLADDHVQRPGDLADVDIGIVTGANHFFILSAQQAQERGLPDSVLTPVVERPSHVRGLSVRDEEHKVLLLIGDSGGQTHPSVQTYLREGKRGHIDLRYKCRKHRAWYSVPLPRKQPHAFLPYMTGDIPRLIVNTSGAWSTNLLHGVTFRAPVPDPRAVSAAMLSSVTRLSAEVEGRAYGGGVLKLETRESERLLVPRIDLEQQGVLVRLHSVLDSLVRNGQQLEASRIVDAVLGVVSNELNTAREVFRSRRTERRGA
jgi:hypothetical protein